MGDSEQQLTHQESSADDEVEDVSTGSDSAPSSSQSSNQSSSSPHATAARIPQLVKNSPKGNVSVRPDSFVRYKPSYLIMHGNNEEALSDYLNLFTMLFSMLGLMMRLKWSGWLAVLLASINFANARATDENRQLLSSFMLASTAVVMCYLQNPQPLVMPFAGP